MKTISEAIKEVVNFDFKTATQEEIEKILPTFGMNDEELDEIPKIFEKYLGWGIKFWQYPNQFSKLLVFLRDKDIDSYLEIGVRHGGTFILINELLMRNNPLTESHCIDVIPPSEILDIYQHNFAKKSFIYHQMTSHDTFLYQRIEGTETIIPQKKFDLIFIDGCHSYQCVKRDYLASLMFGPKYLVFHDIVNVKTKGCKLFWSELKKIHKKTYEFTDQYDGLNGKYLGLGVVEISEDDSIFPLFSANYNKFLTF